MGKIHITPIGTAQYPHLHDADKKFDDEGVFSVDLFLDRDDEGVDEFIAMVDEWCKDKKKCANRNIKTDDDGKIYCKFTSKFKPNLFDARQNRMTDDIKIGSGSKVKVAFGAKSYDIKGGGIKFYLKAVQVIELVEYTGKSAADIGFSEEEGFEAPREEFPDGSKTPPDDSKPSVDDDEIPY